MIDGESRTIRQVCGMAIEQYGEDLQLNVAIEELSELIKEICKLKRGSQNRFKIIEEIADVELMLMQIKIMFDILEKEIDNFKYAKIERLLDRIKHDKTRE